MKLLHKLGISTISLFLLFSSVNSNAYGVFKIIGKDRVDTSIQVSNFVNSDVLVLTSAYNFPDSLSAYNTVSSHRAKLILLGKELPNENILKEIKKVYIVGGENSISSKIEDKVRSIVPNTVRLSGSNRYKTNEKTIEESGYRVVGVADGRNYPDALSCTGLLNSRGYGLLLVDGSKNYTTPYSVEFTFGGKNSVIQEGGRRISGSNRYVTSENINKLITYSNQYVYTTGENYADALSALNLLGKSKQTSIILSRYGDKLKNLKDSNKHSTYVIGGALLNSNKPNNNSNTSYIEIKEINEKKKALDEKTKKAFYEKVLEIVNKERAKVGFKPLSMDENLMKAAEYKSNDMATKNYFSHNSPEGLTPSGLINKFGVRSNYSGENIAAGSATPEAVMEMWMNSPGHRSNILNPNYSKIGIGVSYNENNEYGFYWTQDFSSDYDSSTKLFITNNVDNTINSEVNIRNSYENNYENKVKEKLDDSMKRAFYNGVLELVNQERQKVGSAPLEFDSKLMSAAKYKAEDMASNNYMKHTSLDGTSFTDLLARFGVNYGWRAENIASGANTPEKVMYMWMHSSGHRANILNPVYTRFGIGVAYNSNSRYGYYWAQEFLGDRDNNIIHNNYISDNSKGNIEKNKNNNKYNIDNKDNNEDKGKDNIADLKFD